VALGDDAAGYKALWDGIIKEIAPRDIFETFWVKDIADHMWEIQRYRKLEAKLLEEQAGPTARSVSVVVDSGAESSAQMEAFDWVYAQMQATGKDRMELWKEIEPERQRLEAEHREDALARHLARSTGPDQAASFLKHAAELDRLSRAMSLAQARYTAAVVEIERHRMRQAARAADEIVDASFTEAP
jgi:hypothetical protein